MKSIVFVTSNDVKFKSANHLVGEKGFKLERSSMDLQEIQSDNGKEIVLHKVAQAYAELKRPVVVSDDTWMIPGLNGWPGPYMKYMNDWLTPEDFLRLTEHLTDRRIILRQHSAYQDENQQKYFVGDINGILLKEIRGANVYSHITITSLDGGKHSGAELIEQGKPAIIADKDTVWHHFADWLEEQNN